ERMGRCFNITGSCFPELHYMVDITDRLAEIKEMVRKGDYFIINRGRQYGKTTTLRALEGYLSDEYYVAGMDFQRQMSAAKFKDEYTFSSYRYNKSKEPGIKTVQYEDKVLIEAVA
ncbi:MAG: hypothetical protein ILP22_09590, partial [Oscillospiraceae bacterium]|nr:hypothetical protein [Oscillospiraceae bacterium]